MTLTLSPRKAARFLAVQAVYCHLLRPALKDTTRLLEHLGECHLPADPPEIENVDSADTEHCALLIEKSLHSLEEHKTRIASHLSEKWSIERIGHFQQALLMTAISELTWALDVPYRVIIDEYVTMAGWFLDEKEVTFVNAVLDKCAREIRPEETA